jgi:hypothetical protein
MGIVFFLLLLLSGFLWLFCLRYIPAENAIVYNVPISSIQYVEICPEGPSPLVNHNIVVTDKNSIQEIMTAVRSAQPYFVNHPVTRWECSLAVLTSTGEGYVAVLRTEGQGTIIGYHFRNDKVAEILEKATGQNGSKTQ